MADNETIADITAEMFDRADKLEHNKLGQVFADSFAKLHREYASRVDAAAKRMECKHKKELEARDAVIQTEVAAREAERDAHKREMKETVRRVSQVAEEMTRGTAKGVAPTRKDVDEWAVRLYDTIDITILAPARNCDRFNNGNCAKLRSGSESPNRRSSYLSVLCPKVNARPLPGEGVMDLPSSSTIANLYGG